MAETNPEFKFEIDRDNLEVRISRVFRATPARMWRVHTTPELLEKWWRNTRVEEFELKPGGQWRFVSSGPNGQEFVVGGEFRELDEPRKIVRTFSFAPGHELVETTAFEALPGGSTRQVTVSKFASLDDLNNMSRGMEYGAEPGMELLASVAEAIN